MLRIIRVRLLERGMLANVLQQQRVRACVQCELVGNLLWTKSNDRCVSRNDNAMNHGTHPRRRDVVIHSFIHSSIYQTRGGKAHR